MEKLPLGPIHPGHVEGDAENHSRFGLRWDLLDQGHEIWNRNSMFGPTIPNPSAGGLLGGMIYEGNGPGRCNCKFIPKYPYAIGPRLGVRVSDQPEDRAPRRMGRRVRQSCRLISTSRTRRFWAWASTSFRSPSPTFGEPAVILRKDWSTTPADLHKVTLDPGARPSPGQVNSPNYYLDPNAGRPGRIHQWNISLQREVMQNLVVEAAYVGNRGAWLTGANGLVSLNAISDQRLASVRSQPDQCRPTSSC